MIAGGEVLRSQQPAPADGHKDSQNAPTTVPSFTSDVKVVNVLVTVRNKQGQIMRNLTKDDFVLEEDGRPQNVGYFSKESDLPLTLGLLVDTSPSQKRVLEEERSASYKFLDQVLREDQDQAFVLHFESQVELLQDLTSSRKLLEDALAELRVPDVQQQGGGSGGRRSGGGGYPGGGYPGGGYPGGGYPGGGYPGGGGWPGGGGMGWPGGGWPGGGGRYPRGGAGGGPAPQPRTGARAAGGTALYDAVFLASDELMKKRTGRKALIILSDGVDNASKESMGSAIEAAQRADTLVYSILFYDAQAYSRGGLGGMGRRGGSQESHPDGKSILERISSETGGRMYEVSKKQTVAQIYASIQEELRNQYSLGYSPDRGVNAPNYRKIHVTVPKQKDVTVQARDGYYANK